VRGGPDERRRLVLAWPPPSLAAPAAAVADALAAAAVGVGAEPGGVAP
jgi:hypothetical protein